MKTAFPPVSEHPVSWVLNYTTIRIARCQVLFSNFFGLLVPTAAYSGKKAVVRVIATVLRAVACVVLPLSSLACAAEAVRERVRALRG